MILADDSGTAALWGFAAAGVVAVVTQVGSMIVKHMRGPEVQTPEDKLMDEWEGIAAEARRELTECRTERQRQDKVIGDQGKRIDRLEEAVDDFRRELGQWRNGQRVPEGFVLQRAPRPRYDG